ncbi:uncharacterized protein [Ptychodera flava]|uniref:uncharacterized protein n=1 Tax=Ptychodera flava TaxID=63121 RepID=UPI00396A4D44
MVISTSHTRPYYHGFYYGHHIRENKTTINVDVVKAAPGHQLSLAPPRVPDHNITHPISLEIRDGITSQAPLLRQVTNLTDLTTVFSTSGYLHITLTMDSLYHDYSDTWVSILRSRQRCPTGYYKCASSDVCVGISAVCDGYDHCGDNSDEIHSSLNCSKNGQCSSGPPYGCLSERADCYDSYRYKVFCYCEYGYSGDKCEYEIQGCDWQCQHDGTCIDYIDVTVDLYLEHMGTSVNMYTNVIQTTNMEQLAADTAINVTAHRNIMVTDANVSLHDKYEYGDDSSPDSGLITILIPLVVIFVVFTGCIVCLKRSRCGQQATANNTSTTVVTAAQVVFVNNETSLPPFTDSPPSYTDAVPAARNSPYGAFLEGHDPCDDQLTPPPTYETIVSPLANAVYSGNSNTDLQRDQTEQSAPSGDGNQTV